MDNSTLYIILVAFVICWSILIVLLHKKTKNNTSNNNTMDLADEELTTPDDIDLVNEKDAVTISSKEIDAIVLRNSSGDELSFSKARTDLPGKYVELKNASYAKTGADLLKTGLPVAEKAYTLAELSKKAPNGLFTATVSPDKLSKFTKDKTFTTIVRNDKNIEKHAGFKEIETLSNVNPLMATEMAMAAMAAVSGQYYLNKINDQLAQLNVSVDRLFAFHNDEKIAILQNAAQRFFELSNKQAIDDNDIAQLRRLGDDVANVCYEYRPKVEELWLRLNTYSTEKNKATISVEEYEKLLHEWNYYRSICREASRLEQMSKALEIILRERRDASDSQIDQLLHDLESSFSTSFFCEDNKSFADSISKLRHNAAMVVVLNKKRERDKKKQEKVDHFGEVLSGFQLQQDKTSQLSVFEEMIEDKRRAEVIFFEDEKGETRTFLPATELLGDEETTAFE